LIRLGVDFGGTKIEAAALDRNGEFLARVRKPNPGDYEAAIGVVRDLVAETEQKAGGAVARVGVGLPGSLSPKTGLVRNANSTWLNGRPFDRDLASALGREVRMANDANCFTLSEAVDGAGAGARVVFGVIIGTGCGGGLVINASLHEGPNGIAGEWGHAPLPWPSMEERGSHLCWCGRTDCLETWISGTAFMADFHRHGGQAASGAQIVAAARSGDVLARSALDRYLSRLGRGFAMLCDVLDPDVLVLGGGMSNVTEIYERVPATVARYMFSDIYETRIVPAKYGDSSGVRGAAWLWPWD
jgi:fructokinase